MIILILMCMCNIINVCININIINNDQWLLMIIVMCNNNDIINNNMCVC